jgi:hypothetical protein
LAGHLLERKAAVAELIEHRERRVEHGGIDLPVAWTTHPRRGV